MIKIVSFFIAYIVSVNTISGQKYSSQIVFSHNDYRSETPFKKAYEGEVGYIEADIFLTGGEILVAHESSELKQTRNLVNMYLQPLVERINQNKGLAYPDSTKSLTLMIDVKTEAIATLDTLIGLLIKFPTLLECRSLDIVISGNRPPPDQWPNYPTFIYFDGRPGVEYPVQAWAKVRLVSESFLKFSVWNGVGKIPDDHRKRLIEIIRSVHLKNKKIRFWAIPDDENSWKQLLELGVDILNTDKPIELVEYLNR